MTAQKWLSKKALKTYVSILFAQVNQQEAKGSLGLSRMAKE